MKHIKKLDFKKTKYGSQRSTFEDRTTGNGNEVILYTRNYSIDGELISFCQINLNNNKVKKLRNWLTKYLRKSK